MDHRKKYIEGGPLEVSHKARLRRILNILGDLDVDEKGKFADFDCSSGFILNLVSQIPKYRNWKFFGFDYSKENLSRGEKRFSHIKFNEIDLNVPDKGRGEKFDIVTSFETLEHVEDYRTGFRNLYRKTKPGGKILISVPNETFLQGFVKLIGRYLRGDKYLDRKMINTWREKVSYLSNLITNKDIEKFRKKGCGFSHLGFDYRNLENYIKENYVSQNKLSLNKKGGVFLGFYKVYLFEKTNGN